MNLKQLLNSSHGILHLGIQESQERRKSIHSDFCLMHE